MAEKILTPTRKRPRIRIGMVGARPMIKAPAMKKRSARMIVGFLPYLSEKGPPMMDPTAAPI